MLLDEVRQRVWNQGLATVVIGLSPEALAAYSVLRRHEKSIELSFDDASVDGPWSPYDFITGAIQRRVPSWFEPERRVDQSLLDSLTALINNLAPDIQRRPAEALVAQIIFLRYLEDRGIVADTYRTKHQIGRLQDLVAKSDGVGVDRLISELGETFAGDFLRNTGFSPPPWSSLSSTAFRHIGEFLSGENADPECARNAVKGAAAIIDRIAREPEFIRGYHYETYRPALDALVGDFFGLSDVERAIVEETARDIAPSLQPRGFASVESALTTQPDAAVGQRYADALASALARFRQARKGEGGFEIAVDVGAAGRVFGSVRIGIKDRDRSLVEAASNVQQLLADLSSISPDRALVRMADTILAVGESLFLIKPLQRRFWGMRAALEDCDKIMAAIDGTLSETSALAAE